VTNESPASVFPLRTRRLLLRPFVAADAPARFRLDSDPAIQCYLGGPTSKHRSEMALMHDIEDFERVGYGVLAAIDAEGGDIVGYAALQREPSRDHLELVIALEGRVRQQRLGTEIAEALLLTAFRHLGAPEIVGRVNPDNTASAKLVANLGMSRVEDRVDPLTGTTEHVYSLSREAWLQGRIAAG